MESSLLFVVVISLFGTIRWNSDCNFMLQFTSSTQSRFCTHFKHHPYFFFIAEVLAVEWRNRCCRATEDTASSALSSIYLVGKLTTHTSSCLTVLRLLPAGFSCPEYFGYVFIRPNGFNRLQHTLELNPLTIVPNIMG